MLEQHNQRTQTGTKSMESETPPKSKRDERLEANERKKNQRRASAAMDEEQKRAIDENAAGEVSRYKIVLRRILLRIHGRSHATHATHTPKARH